MADLFDYVALSKTAASLINRFGDSVKVTTFVDIPTNGGIDPPTRTRKDWDTKAVSRVAKSQEVGQAFGNGLMVLMSDKIVLLAGDGSDLPVDANGTIAFGTDLWKIMSVQQIKPGPVSMLYKVLVRK
jgi:hypothetical protein